MEGTSFTLRPLQLLRADALVSPPPDCRRRHRPGQEGVDVRSEVAAERRAGSRHGGDAAVRFRAAGPGLSQLGGFPLPDILTTQRLMSRWTLRKDQ